jgi:hypothetical protein
MDGRGSRRGFTPARNEYWLAPRGLGMAGRSPRFAGQSSGRRPFAASWWVVQRRRRLKLVENELVRRLNGVRELIARLDDEESRGDDLRPPYSIVGVEAPSRPPRATARRRPDRNEEEQPEAPPRRPVKRTAKRTTKRTTKSTRRRT